MTMLKRTVRDALRVGGATGPADGRHRRPRLEIDLDERRIDLLPQAPKLQQLPVHRVAKATGPLLS
jgi:hypothetical protein